MAAERRSRQHGMSIRDFLGSPQSLAFISGDDQKRLNAEGQANMLKNLERYKGSRLGIPSFKNWYFPNDMPDIDYTHNMPIGFLGQWNKLSPDMVSIRPGPEPGFEEAYKFMDLPNVLVHENIHRTQTAQNMGNYYGIDVKYFPKESDRKKFVNSMLDILEFDDRAKDAFYSNYKTPMLQMDELRARLMAEDAAKDPDNPIWKKMDPTAISWLLESTRSGWNPEKSDKEEKLQQPAGGRKQSVSK
jgi:hypothetical protein